MTEPFVKRWLIRLVVLACLAGGGYYGWTRLQPAEAFEVRTVQVVEGPLELTVATTGRLSPTTEVVVGCEVSGTVESIEVDHNDRVAKGQIIARLKPELYRAEFEQSKSDLARATAELHRLQVQEREANREFNRISSLVETRAETPNAMETARAARDAAAAATEAGQATVDSAQSRVKLAEYRLDRSVITSPIDGVVLDRQVDVGQTIAATLQSPVMFILAEDLTRMELLADVSEADIGYLTPGQSARFTVNAYRDRTFPGTVMQIRNQPRTIRDVVTYTVVIDVGNRDRLLRPGMPADVNIQVLHRDRIDKVPNAALRFRPPLPPDETRRLLETMKWADPPEPMRVSAELPTTRPDELTVLPPPIEPAQATLWRFVGGVWQPVGVWTLFTDNRETAVVLPSDLADDAGFAVEVQQVTSSASRLQEAIMMARPENRMRVLERSKQ